MKPPMLAPPYLLKLLLTPALSHRITNRHNKRTFGNNEMGDDPTQPTSFSRHPPKKEGER